MAKAVVWTKRADKTYDKILKYLEAEWGEKATRAFVIQTHRVIELIAAFPHIGSLEHEERSIRGFLLTKHNRLFYKESKGKIIILNIFDTRQHVKKKKF